MWLTLSLLKGWSNWLLQIRKPASSWRLLLIEVNGYVALITVLSPSTSSKYSIGPSSGNIHWNVKLLTEGGSNTLRQPLKDWISSCEGPLLTISQQTVLWRFKNTSFSQYTWMWRHTAAYTAQLFTGALCVLPLYLLYFPFLMKNKWTTNKNKNNSLNQQICQDQESQTFKISTIGNPNSIWSY